MSTWWVDDPISTPDAEALGRGPFVARLIAMLGEIGAHPSSTVVALVGPWGSGKTSTINLVLDGLGEESWGIARVNPWALGSPEAIVTELLGAVRSALPERSRTAREKLTDYSRYLPIALSAVPGGAGAATQAAKLLEPDSTVQSAFEKLSDEMRALTRPVLVFVDDVDRLQPDELLALLRAIRVVGRLPNVHYLVAYDQHTLVDLLKSTSIAGGREDRALAFLEKIVTLRADQPMIRAGQSSALFNDGLTTLLADLRANLGDEERRRLSDEWELLLSHDLAEPRTISRFIAQLRVYLPLVGPDEVDLVDYLVVTHLRSMYPPVYRALLTDRLRLVAPILDTTDPRIDFWRRVPSVSDLGLPADRAERVSGAIRRLFPALEQGDRVAPRRRGVSDPDYVDRYFTFPRGPADVTDAELTIALRDWALGGAADMPAVLIGPLNPNARDRGACEISAGVIRRLEVLTEQMSPAETGSLLVGAVRCLPLPSGPGFLLGGPDAAIIQWLIRMLGRAVDLDVPGLLDLLGSKGTQGLIDFLRAFAVARVTITADWLGALAEGVGNIGWRLFRTHLDAGDAAPDVPAETLFNLVEQILGTDETGRRLRRAVDEGVPVSTLAARLVEVGVASDTGRPVVVDVDAATMIQRIGEIRVAAAGLTRPEVPADLDPNNVSWTSRRLHAEAALLAVAGTAEGGRRLPRLPTGAPQPFEQRPSVLLTPGSVAPDLRVAVAVLMPHDASLSSPITPAGPAWGGPDILSALEQSPLTRWMARTAKSWPVSAEPWDISDTADGHLATHAGAVLRSVPESGSARLHVPIRAAAKIWTGRQRQRPFLAADFEAGLWLSDLGPLRLPAGRRHISRPMPAALSLAEVDALLTAMIATSTETAAVLFRRMAEPFDNSTMVLRVAIDIPTGLNAVVNLRDLHHLGDRGVSFRLEHHFAFAPGRQDAALCSRDWALALLSSVLSTAGYRNYEGALLALRD